MQPIAEWLVKIGLERYAPALADNDIDVSVLPHLTEADLEKIGVSLGHRRKMLVAIAELSNSAQAPQQSTLTRSKPEELRHSATTARRFERTSDFGCAAAVESGYAVV